MQRLVVNTLFQEVTDHHNQKDGSKGTQKIGTVLEVTTSCLYGKHGVENRIWSLSEDNTHSWVRISHGSNKFVMDSNNNNNTESPDDLSEEQALQMNVKDFACRSKAKSKTAKKRTCWLFTEHHSDERKELDWYWTRELLSLSAYEVSKKVIHHLIRHSQQVHREEDGAVQFWRIKKSSEPIPTVYSSVWRSMESMLGSRRRSKKVAVLHWWFRNNHLFPSSSRTFKTQSYLSFIAGQYCDSERILPIYLPYWMWIQSSFSHQLWTTTWRSKFEQVFFLPIDLRDKSHKDLEKDWLECTTSCTIPAQCMEETQDAVYWVDIDLAIEKGLTFYQTRSNAIILQETLPAYCIPKVVRLKTGEV